VSGHDSSIDIDRYMYVDSCMCVSTSRVQNILFYGSIDRSVFDEANENHAQVIIMTRRSMLGSNSNLNENMEFMKPNCIYIYIDIDILR
jgi:hypothetical protein